MTNTDKVEELNFESYFEIGVGQLGLDPSLFWSLTPYELSVMVEGRAKREREEYNKLLFLAWHTEAFARQKKLPKLKSLFKEEQKKQVKSITTDELIKIAKQKGLKVPRGDIIGDY